MLNAPFPTRNGAEAWRASQAQAPTKSRPSLGVLIIRLLLLIGLAFVMAMAFFFFGEETPEPIARPLLTAQQRAQAFRF